MRLESKAASTKTPGNSCGRSPSSWSITEVILKVIFCWQVQFAMRLSQDASHHIFAFQPEEGGRFARIRQMSLLFCGDFLQRQTWGGGFVMEIAIFTKLCVSLKFIPTNEPRNQLMNLQISSLRFDPRLYWDEDFECSKLFEPKKTSSAENRISSGTALMTRRLLWPSFCFVKHV